MVALRMQTMAANGDRRGKLGLELKMERWRLKIDDEDEGLLVEKEMENRKG